MNTLPHSIAVETAPERLNRRFFAPAAIALLALAPAALAECPPRFEITLIEGPDCGIGGPNPHARGMNELGHFVGDNGCHAAAQQAMAWYGADPAMLLPEPPGTYYSGATDINNIGWIVGWAEITTTSGTRGLVWHDGVIDVIEPFEGAYHSTARGLNDIGEVVGSSDYRAFIWSSGERRSLHPIVPGDPQSWASDINDASQIVGASGIVSSATAVLLDGDSVVSLGHIPGGYNSEACAINEHGEIVGIAYAQVDGSGTTTRGFYWHDGKILELPVLEGFGRSRAIDINDDGSIVGWCWDPSTRACLWTSPDTPYELDDLIVPHDPSIYLQEAHAINNAGQIAGRAFQSGHFYVFVLNPLTAVHGDLDCDRIVGFLDLLTVLSSWGPCPDGCNGDADDNGIVDSFDLLLVLAGWS